MTEPAVRIVMTPEGPVSQPVTLGRDTARRPYRRLLARPWRKVYQCLCCDAYTLDAVDCCDICPRCGWEDWYECHDSPDEKIPPNRLSLNEARRVVAAYGGAACTHANQSGGLSLSDLERMSPAERSELKSIYVKDRP